MNATLTQAICAAISASNSDRDNEKVLSCQPVGGGSINQTFKLTTRANEWFVKLNHAAKLWMFEAESAGLTALAQPGIIRVPKPLLTGISGNHAYIVMEALPLGRSDSNTARRFGEQLAELHKQTQSDRYGFAIDNTIGATDQPNDWRDDWLSFWRDKRLGFQLDLALERGMNPRSHSDGRQLCADLERFFDDFRPQASLLHGDLWGGNFAALSDGEPTMFDPACYYGDRETDIAMTELFGGFGPDFYQGYNSVWPLDPGYERRKTLYNLYHILNHFNLFGGGYGTQAEQMIHALRTAG